MFKVEMLKYETERTMEHEWIKLRTRQPEWGDVERGGVSSPQPVRRSRKRVEETEMVLSHQSLLYSISCHPKSALQEAKPGQHNRNETIPAAVFFSGCGFMTLC